MSAWLSANSGTIVVLLVLAVIVLLIVRNLIMQKKSGKSSCGGNCSFCGGGCSHSEASSAESSLIKTVVRIEGMSCDMCESHINDAIRNNFSVKGLKTSHTTGISVILSDKPIDSEKLKSVITSLGYVVSEIKVG